MAVRDMATRHNVILYLVHVYLDGDFEWGSDNELNKLIYEHGRIQTLPLGIYEPDAESIYKKLKTSNLDLESIKKVLKNPDRIVICTVDKYDDYDFPDAKRTFCTGLLVKRTAQS